jgi:AraC-like DNA-binding protein
VKWLWAADSYSPGPHRQERILPTGESALIIDLGERGGAGISGPQSESFVIDVASQFAVAGVQFTPGGAFVFFDPPQQEIANRHVALDALWGGLAATLREQVLAAGSPAERLDAIERVLLTRLTCGRLPHPAVLYAVQQFDRRTHATVANVVHGIGLSHRRFLDLFTAQVGLTPKRFARVRRFQRILRRLREGGAVDWVEVALSCGYYDQAHFIKEFAAFSGVNPTTYRAVAGSHVNHLPI